MAKRRLLCITVLASLATATAFGQSAGRIVGRVTRADGTGVSGVTVAVDQTSKEQVTDGNGSFSFDDVPVGTHSLTFTLRDLSDSESGLEVRAGSTATVEKVVGWPIGFAERLTVTSASVQRERIVDAPAAITVVTEDEIASKAAFGQVPKLVEFTPGANVTQSGIYDFNLNTRGFNSSLNRRVLTLIDGRDPGVPYLGSQEWAAISFPVDDLASVEFLRGPSAALYGANASSGVLNLTSKAPRYSQGGQARLTAGELDTLSLDVRWAVGLGGDWYMKTVAGVRRTGDFTVSRTLDPTDPLGSVEYSVPCVAPGQVECLPLEGVPPHPLSDDEVYFGGLRFDKYLPGGRFFTVEGGLATIKGPVLQTGLGRVQVGGAAEGRSGSPAKRPWARFNFTAPRWNVLMYYTGREAPSQLNLRPGNNFALDTFRLQLEGRYNRTFAQDRIRVVVGGAYGHDDIDTADPDSGRQTLIFEPVTADRVAVFGQADWSLTDRLKVVFAGRFDDNTLFEAQFSPKAALVYRFDPSHTVRFTYNRAFQAANYTELFLQGNIAAPADLSAIEELCTPFGVDCGFTRPTPVLALGNRDLDVEHIQTLEVGYSAIIQQKAFFTIDYYRSRASDFITDLLPQLGTPLGRTNPNFGPWEPPEPLPPAVVTAIRELAPPTLSNNVDRSNILAALSYSNFGEVDTQGVEVGLNFYFADPWRVSFAYSWFDFQLQEDTPPEFEPLLAPNSPEHTVRLGLGYRTDRWDADAAVRWVDDFFWAAGVFQGPVSAYAAVDVSASVRLLGRWRVGANVSNVFDSAHYEAFGGDLLGRRALVYVAFDWQH